MGMQFTRRTILKAAGAVATSSLFPEIVTAEQKSFSSDDSWRMFRRDVVNSGIALGALPDQPELLWELKTPDGVSSTPVISNGRTYVGTVSGDLHCLNLVNGEVRWTYKSVEVVEKNSFAPAFNAPLAMNDELVFAGDEDGVFHAVDLQNGKKKWDFRTDAEIVGGALVLNDKVLFGSHDNFLYCLKAATGEQIWKCETQGPVNATPTLAGPFTFTTGCDKPILRVIEIEKGIQSEEVPLDALLLASAAVKDDILYFGTDGGSVFAIEWRKRKTLWTYSIPNVQQQIHSSPAVTDDVVIIGSRDKNVHCLDRVTGQPRWVFKTRAQIDGSPVVCGDRVYFGSGDKNLYALSIADGKEVWKFNAGQGFTGSAAIAEGTLVIGTESANGRILCFGKKP